MMMSEAIGDGRGESGDVKNNLRGLASRVPGRVVEKRDRHISICFPTTPFIATMHSNSLDRCAKVGGGGGAKRLVKGEKKLL